MLPVLRIHCHASGVHRQMGQTEGTGKRPGMALVSLQGLREDFCGQHREIPRSREIAWYSPVMPSLRGSKTKELEVPAEKQIPAGGVMG